MRDVYILGVGTTACGRFPDKGSHVLGREAAWAAIKDAEIDPKNIEISHLKTYHVLLVKTVLKFSFSHETLLRLWYVKPSQNNNFNILREALSFT